MKSLLLLLVCVAIQAADDKLMYVIEVARHGARAPSKIFPLAADEAKNFKVAKELTPLGIR